MLVVCPHCKTEFNTNGTSKMSELREAKGLSMQGVCDLMGKGHISVKQLGRVEKGEAVPELGIARRLAKIYGSTVDALWPEPAEDEDDSGLESADEDDPEHDLPMAEDRSDPIEDRLAEYPSASK